VGLEGDKRLSSQAGTGAAPVISQNITVVKTEATNPTMKEVVNGILRSKGVIRCFEMHVSCHSA
jgi:hypothetical protein